MFVWADAAVKTGAWQRRLPPRLVCFSTKRRQRARGAPPHAEECTKEGPRARHRRRLGALRRSGTALWRGYLLKEGLRAVFRGDPADARASLDRWLSWARRCRIPQFVELSRKVRRKREGVLRSIELGVSNARVEAVNNKIKVAVRQGYGFRNIDNLIALVMLRCSDLRPALPGRAAA